MELQHSMKHAKRYTFIGLNMLKGFGITNIANKILLYVLSKVVGGF